MNSTKTIRKNATKKIRQIAEVAVDMTVTHYTLDNEFTGTDRVFGSVDELAEYISDAVNHEYCDAKLRVDMDRRVATLRWHSNHFANIKLSSVIGM